MSFTVLLKRCTYTKCAVIGVLGLIIFLAIYSDSDPRRNEISSIHPHAANISNSRPRSKHYCNKFGRQRTVSHTEITEQLKTGPRSVCKCPWIQNTGTEVENQDQNNSNNDTRKNMLVESTCSAEATLSGDFQKVISYSFFTANNAKFKSVGPVYFRGISDNLKLMNKLYPGWVMRLYSNVPLEGEMCHILCSSQDIFYCDVSHLPAGLGDVRGLHEMTWRFLLIGDGTVEKFAIRDLDSRLSQRERDAVREWEGTSFPFHGMRDHPWHGTEMMGGMWGADNYKLCLPTGARIRKKLTNPLLKSRYNYNDQDILSKLIYFKFEKMILNHDSYLCQTYEDSIPFPTKRPNDYEYVGQPCVQGFNTTLPSHCPVNCRPEYGMDWEYC